MPGLRGFYRSLRSVSRLIALGGAELDGAEYVFERLSRA